VDAFRGFYRLAELRRAAEAALDGVDLLCVPTIPYFVTLEEIAADPLGPNARLGTYTNFVNLLDLCGIAVPTAPRSDGRPGSVTLLARAGRDGLAAGLADALQRAGGLGVGAKGRAVAAPPPGPAAAGPDETAIAVVGAHMSGLPLNRDLTARGARFLEATATAPEYRLYALPGGPPARPGLLRVGPEDGAAVAIEIWALPSAQVGDFLATVPAPLAIGSVRTAAGGLCKGFLVESAAVAGARDITAFGGWRAFLAAG
jgi:allophanate hydrolase